MRFICGLCWAVPVWAAAQVASGGLTLEVMEGDGAVYNVRARTATPPRVRVADAAGQPVDGAFVTFRLPESGPGALFADGRIATVSTDAQGHAAAPALKLNSQLGPWEIRIAAVHRGMVTRASIQQINAAPVESISGGGKRSRGLYWLAAVSAGAAVAASVGFRNSSSPVRSGGVGALGAAASGPQTVSIGVGAGSIGAP